MTVWPCACADEMRPLERRLWVQYFKMVKGARAALDHSQWSSIMTSLRSTAEQPHGS